MGRGGVSSSTPRNITTSSYKLSTTACCAMPGRPASADQLMIWETKINGMSVREIPGLAWVALLPGINNVKPLFDKPFVEGVGAITPKMRTAMQSNDLKQRGTQNTSPFDFLRDDGLGAPGVEFYSGALQMWSESGGGQCQIQRILPIDPELFSKLLLYHTSNNKQASITRERRV